ncbi:hypothetical protein P7H12_17840 [Paenibacillus larvae]|nr:hypothetical protein [Paenibacillus larvae]MDT2265067.1 hypothetical protein [Paenibacillus larvae]
MILILFIWTITSIAYPVSGKNSPDDAAFRTYGNGFGNKADWRRDNVNQAGKVSHALGLDRQNICQIRHRAFGVWRNKSSDPNGSDTEP